MKLDGFPRTSRRTLIGSLWRQLVNSSQIHKQLRVCLLDVAPKLKIKVKVKVKVKTPGPNPSYYAHIESVAM